jgi:NAD(P)-dependent dehydrogenase (short-subunit alcohol dehydrogenase family)/ribosomal protein S18 acetylase RimI-like enzyme
MTEPDRAAISLRLATIEDIPYLLELRRQTMTAHQIASGAEASERERAERVLYRFESAQIIERDGAAIGTLKLAKDGRDWHLVQIQITPALQSQGIGKRLIERVIADARAARARLRLNVLHSNPALRLYERLGFRVASRGPHDFEMQLVPSELASAPPLRTPFGFDSTAFEVVRGIDLRGKRAIVTGGASGIGVETARALAAAGAAVTLAVRDVAAGERVAADMTRSTATGGVSVSALDLVDQASIDAFVARWDGPLHILVNNAGVMAIEQLQLSRAGHEMQFASNHLGHFALALGLHGALAAAQHARIVCVSSSGHLRSPVVFDDIDFAFRDYDPFGAYGQSKTANVLFAVAASTRWASDGITANALMPGGIATNLQRHVGGARYTEQARERFREAGSRFKTPEQGAATSVLLATSPLLEGIGGRYFEDCNEALPVERRTPTSIRGVAPYALDPDNADRLWQVSLEMLARAGGSRQHQSGA